MCTHLCCSSQLAHEYVHYKLAVSHTTFSSLTTDECGFSVGWPGVPRLPWTGPLGFSSVLVGDITLEQDLILAWYSVATFIGSNSFL